MKKKKAFTILEILVVMALMVTLFGISLPVYQSLMFGTEVESASKIAASSIRTAQSQSMAQLYDSGYGVEITSTSIVIFKGNDYVNRDKTADVTYTIPTGVSISGLTEIIFEKNSGKPDRTGSITFSQYEKVYVVEINEISIKNY